MVSKIESRGEAASAGGPGRVLAQSTQLSGALGLKAVRNAWSEKDVGQERNQNTGYRKPHHHHNRPGVLWYLQSSTCSF